MTKCVFLRFFLSEVELLIGSNTRFPRVRIVIGPFVNEDLVVTEREAAKSGVLAARFAEKKRFGQKRQTGKKCGQI